MNPYIQAIYNSGKVIGEGGVEIALNHAIDPQEGEFIHKIISQDSSISTTLEVGCAYGLSSLHICDALRARANPQHTIIDPSQRSSWHSIGIRNLEGARMTFFTLIEKRSEFALPELLSLKSVFDFIFIDGWHTFDHTLIDCFYATRLLRTGGYLVIDDANIPPVARVIDYLSFYPCYQTYAILGDSLPKSLKRSAVRMMLAVVPPSIRKRAIHPAMLRRMASGISTRMVALKKTSDDKRKWNWFPNGF